MYDKRNEPETEIINSHDAYDGASTELRTFHGNTASGKMLQFKQIITARRSVVVLFKPSWFSLNLKQI